MVEPGFRDVWEELIAQKRKMGRSSLPHHRRLADGSVVFATNGVLRSINKARHVTAFITGRTGDGRMPLVPVQMIIDAGTYTTVDGAVSRESDIAWPEMAPGVIYLTPAAYRLLRGTENLTFTSHATEKFYRFIDKRRPPPAGPVSFSFAAAMFQGSRPPCFYCGLRGHASERCPSKMPDRQPGAVDSLGYLSPAGLNDLFFGYLMGKKKEQPHPDTAYVKVTYDTAADAAMELLYIHQLRFFALLWGAPLEENWDKAAAGGSGSTGAKGGPAWLAFDCVRSVNHAQAEAIIGEALATTPHDFRLYCVLGYLHIERDRPDRAADAFGRALALAQTNPQRIFIHFMLFRIGAVGGSRIDAEKHLDEILAIEPACRDAVYFQAVLGFSRGDARRSLENIIPLIHHDRRYFIRALIAPELAPYQCMIGPRLGKIYEQARDIAAEGMRTAETEMDRLKKLLGEDDRFTRAMASMAQKARGLIAAESYFGYLDAAHAARTMVAGARREIGRRQEKIFQLLANLDERAFALLVGARSLAAPAELHAELRSIRETIDAVRKDIRLETDGAMAVVLDTVRRMTGKMDKAGSRLERRKNRRLLRNFIVTFFKVSLIFQSINFLVGLMVLPLTARCFTAGLSGDDLAFCKAGALLVGGTAGFMYAVVKGLAHVLDE